MAVRFTVVPKKNPQNREAEPRYYPVLKSTGRTTQRDLANKGEKISTLSAADLAAAMEVLLALIPQELLAGNIVELRDFGTFRLSVTAEGSDRADEVSGNKIKNINVRFTPSKEFKHAISAASFKKL